MIALIFTPGFAAGWSLTNLFFGRGNGGAVLFFRPLKTFPKWLLPRLSFRDNLAPHPIADFDEYPKHHNHESNNTMTKKYKQSADKQDRNAANRDPLTGTPGAHPLGTGVGAAGGGVAGTAIGAVGGPVGAAAGLVAGAIAGGLAGKGVAEQLDPTAEDAYWKANYSKRKYVDRKAPYSMYQAAYRAGYEGRGRYPGKTFEEVESDLQHDYETYRGDSALDWEQARLAARDAWSRGEAPKGS
jgi:hypothetical protein